MLLLGLQKYDQIKIGWIELFFSYANLCFRKILKYNEI